MNRTKFNESDEKETLIEVKHGPKPSSGRPKKRHGVEAADGVAIRCIRSPVEQRLHVSYGGYWA